MEEFFKEIKKQEQTIKKELDAKTKNFTLEQLIKEYEQAKNNFNNHTSPQNATQKERFTKWNFLETTYFYYYDKIKIILVEQIKEETKKALEHITKVDEFITLLLFEHINKLNIEEITTTKHKANKISNIILLISEILEK